ncbi:hypothetical protein F4775DRAFT_284009 [Biscogniauxia sp. FL1348]|nr:hypothetical protein F4775DRAFT_284009 [Biscogniauxia sp. FL1348]
MKPRRVCDGCRKGHRKCVVQRSDKKCDQCDVEYSYRKATALIHTFRSAIACHNYPLSKHLKSRNTKQAITLPSHRIYLPNLHPQDPLL